MDLKIAHGWTCCRCGKAMADYTDVGYDGPKDRSSEECHPFLEWETLCRECAG